MTPIETILLTTGILLLGAAFASKLSNRFGVPSLLLFLGLGMLAGSEGPGGIPFDNAEIAQGIGVVALAFILFSGGLSTEWSSISAVLWKGLSLSTIGVLITAAVVACASRLLLHSSWLESLLLGSVVSSTDAAAVFAILRSSGLTLKGRIQSLLEFESGSNDPMAVFLTLALINLIIHPNSCMHVIWMFVLQMGVGALVGYLFGKASVAVINRVHLDSEGLYPVLTVASVACTYAVAALLGGSGFLAVYIAGMVIGHTDLIHKRSLTRFHDAVAWLVQIAMFLTLGLLVFPSRLVPVAVPGLVLSAVLIFIARPVGVFISLAFARMNLRQRLLVSWVGLRGAAPIVLATFPMVAGLPRADLYFDIVFFIVITSVLLQGMLLPQVARRLGLEAPARLRRPSPLEYAPARRTSSELVEVVVPELSAAAGRRVLELGLPKSALIVLLGRGDDFIAPRGGTLVQAGDRLLVLVDRSEIELLQSMVEGR